MSVPFLLDPAAKGGLGVTPDAQGWITGTVGVIALTAGGLLGGFLIAKYGIKKCFWPMVLSLNIPNLAYVWAGFAKPASTISETLMATNDMGFFERIGPLFAAAFSDPVSTLVAIDQFGYGFGFAAYMVYLLFICQGHRMQTAMYAIATGLMALGAMIAGIASGYVQTSFAGTEPNWNPNAYAYFFIAVCIFAIPGMLTLFFIPMDRADIRKAPIEID
jgi:PAT family beta-lactamase induction signal transducer AmpG